MVQKIYGVPPPPPEEHYGAINDLHTIVQVMQTQRYDPEGMAQANEFLTRYNSAVMEKMSHMTVIMNAMQAQLKTLASDQTNQISSKRKYYCWICGGNYTHGSKTCSSKKAGHQEEAYYKKRLGRSEKGCE